MKKRFGGCWSRHPERKREYARTEGPRDYPFERLRGPSRPLGMTRLFLAVHFE